MGKAGPKLKANFREAEIMSGKEAAGANSQKVRFGRRRRSIAREIWRKRPATAGKYWQMECHLVQ